MGTWIDGGNRATVTVFELASFRVTPHLKAFYRLLIAIDEGMNKVEDKIG